MSILCFYFFYHSSSNSVSIPVYFFAYLHSLPIHFLIFLFPVICFEIPITRIFFSISLEGSSYRQGVICLVPRRLSLDENVRAKEGGKESVLFQWSLAAHHQSLAITLRKTKCLRRTKTGKILVIFPERAFRLSPQNL